MEMSPSSAWQERDRERKRERGEGGRGRESREVELRYLGQVCVSTSATEFSLT